MPPEDEAPAPPSPESVAAAQDVPVAPPPEPEPEPEIAEIPEGDTFDRAYVEGLRNEAAKYRTRARDVEAPFASFAPEERARFLEMAEHLDSNPEVALEEFEGVTNRLRKMVGKEVPVPEEVAPPPEPETAPVSEPAGLTADDVARLVGEQLETARSAQAAKDEITATLAEAEALDDRYKDPVAKAQLFAAAQTNNTDLAGAHKILTGSFDESVEAAVEQRLADIRAGKKHPPRLPTGTPANAAQTEHKLTLADASRRANARLDAHYEQG